MSAISLNQSNCSLFERREASKGRRCNTQRRRHSADSQGRQQAHYSDNGSGGNIGRRKACTKDYVARSIDPARSILSAPRLVPSLAQHLTRLNQLTVALLSNLDQAV